MRGLTIVAIALGLLFLGWAADEFRTRRPPLGEALLLLLAGVSVLALVALLTVHFSR